MISKSSIFLVGMSAAVLLMSGVITEEAAAFVPTKEEQKQIEQVAKLTGIVDSLSDNDPRKEMIQEKLFRAIYKLNALGIYTSDQEPNLDHLTKEYDNTRAAAAAGIEPVDVIPEQMSVVSSECATCPPPVKTMYVKSAYKDPFSFFWMDVICSLCRSAIC